MFRNSKLVTLLAVMMLALVFSVGGTGRASAQASGCDVSASRNGTATPTYGTAGTRIVIRATGFQSGEDVSFWFTLPDGRVAGTAAPVAGGVNPDGSIGPLDFTIEQQDVDNFPGRWAITFQGASSNNTAVIYFCVLTAQQATAVAQPATATAVPPTAVPATATSVPATATTAATTAPTTAPTTVAASPTVAAESPTAAATATTVVVVPTATTVVEVPTATTVVEVPTATTVVEIPTATTVVEVPTVMPEPTMDMGGGVLPTVVGMPRTGQSDNAMLITLVLASLGMLSAGIAVRRTRNLKR